jgi:hypothetical protein
MRTRYTRSKQLRMGGEKIEQVQSYRLSHSRVKTRRSPERRNKDTQKGEGGERTRKKEKI